MSERFRGSARVWAWVVSINTSMNLVKRSLVGGGTRGGVGASREVEVSSLPMLDPLAGFWPTSSFCSPAGSVGELTQGLRQARDPRTIAIELKSKERDAVLLNKLADSMGIELFRIIKWSTYKRNTRLHQLGGDA